MKNTSYYFLLSTWYSWFIWKIHILVGGTYEHRSLYWPTALTSCYSENEVKYLPTSSSGSYTAAHTHQFRNFSVTRSVQLLLASSPAQAQTQRNTRTTSNNDLQWDKGVCLLSLQLCNYCDTLKCYFRRKVAELKNVIRKLFIYSFQKYKPPLKVSEHFCTHGLQCERIQVSGL